ncbi:MAG: phosphatase PAP2 family protein [Candidatus Marinimicrobia bacterium]|nr:phosphatase PAP2 family protein [Candidatus Neomarinimicrobiota bacterium]MCF7829877.1 phosphatase PAP2 family protein [Candidatus Neomarinimicrobiota bacterium]MCF7879160.1 phosphatase PAP2 family protein [Candidatus Neomarinimicrobiota bacterium]
MDIIQFLQSFRNPILDVLFKSLTFLGNEEFFVLLLPIAFWTWRKHDMQRLTFLLLISFAINALLKNAFGLPRPPEAVHLVHAEGFGLPSGHAQGAIVLWGYFALLTEKRWLRISLGVLIGGIAISRLYLGVHYPGDVLAGLAIGGLWLWIFYIFAPKMESGWRSPLLSTIIMIVVLCVTFMSFTTTALGGTVGGLAMGMLAGLLLEHRFVGMVPENRFGHQLGKILLGISGIVILYIGLKTGLPDFYVYRAARYAAIGLWISLAAPWIFVQVGLSKHGK